ncbi:phospholipase C/P1 nuclease [Ascodesmis nigricans]|uniref:Phospholipase C/P1 nuclease n=1 Tax=Ascodesmis nigricans TaxID=341454 RepID=A0A4S2MKW0_9PEZI|nr:phospholipase C/P1 nuclease [Ascodesmis nigricans]
MRILTGFAAATLLLAGHVTAWGRLGHETVALLSQQYLLPETTRTLQTLLSTTSPTFLGDIALWADEFRREPEGAFSTGLHFVNGRDGPPPESCELDYPGDCPPEGCIVGAIANYTQRMMRRDLDAVERARAVKFVVHFLGDIAQPLHTEAYGAGGNNITITFNGYATNLHAAWDTSIPHTLLSLPSNATITSTHSLTLANHLAPLLTVGQYKPTIKRWLRHHTKHAIRTTRGMEKAAAAWAQDGNWEVCAGVITVHPERLQGRELGGGEYEREARRVVERGLVKGAVRLAGWLNLVVVGRTGF